MADYEPMGNVDGSGSTPPPPPAKKDPSVSKTTPAASNATGPLRDGDDVNLNSEPETSEKSLPTKTKGGNKKSAGNGKVDGKKAKDGKKDNVAMGEASGDDTEDHDDQASGDDVNLNSEPVTPKKGGNKKSAGNGRVDGKKAKDGKKDNVAMGEASGDDTEDHDDQASGDDVNLNSEPVTPKKVNVNSRRNRPAVGVTPRNTRSMQKETREKLPAPGKLPNGRSDYKTRWWQLEREKAATGKQADAPAMNVDGTSQERVVKMKPGKMGVRKRMSGQMEEQPKPAPAPAPAGEKLPVVVMFRDRPKDDDSSSSGSEEEDGKTDAAPTVHTEPEQFMVNLGQTFIHFDFRTYQSAFTSDGTAVAVGRAGVITANHKTDDESAKAAAPAATKLKCRKAASY